MVDDQPMVAAPDVSKAGTRAQALRLSILDIGKRVGPGIDCYVAIHADQLIAEGSLKAGKDLKDRHEIIPQCHPIST
jgi:hypothetical protein